MQVELSGTGGTNPGEAIDPFYQFEQPVGTPISPVPHAGTRISRSSCACAPGEGAGHEECSSPDIIDFVVFVEGVGLVSPGSRPVYRPDHSYRFIIDVGATAGPVTIGIHDCGVYDNYGAFQVSLSQLWGPAIIGSAVDGVPSLRLASNAKIIDAGASGDPASTIDAGVCGVDMEVSTGVLVTGPVAASGSALFSGGQPRIRLMNQFVNAGGAFYTGKPAPLVGPPAMCTGGGTPCTTDSDCPNGLTCEERLLVTDPGNPYVDATGMAPEYQRCVSTIASLPDAERTILALSSTMQVGEVHLRSGQSQTIALGHGQQVIDIGALRIGQEGALTIRGFADTVAVFRIAGAFRIGTRSQVVLENVVPENLLWMASGAVPVVHIGSSMQGSFPGTLLAIKRPTVSIGSHSTIEGALIGKRIRIGSESVVQHRPFMALLQGGGGAAATLAVQRADLTFSDTNRATGRIRVRAIVDDSAAKTFRADLLGNMVSLNVRDSGHFDTSAALTGCAQRSDRVFKCRSGDGDTRATLRVLRDDPDIFDLTLTRRHLPLGQTGSLRPTDPISVTMQQSAIQRAGSIDGCRAKGQFSLSCRTP